MKSARPFRAALLIVPLIVIARLLHAQHGDGGVVQFAAHEIGTGLRGGYQTVVTDLNKDGKPDVLALAQSIPELVWYENPGWQRHVIAGGLAEMINAAPNDLDGDGIPEIALAQGFSTNPKTSTGIVSLLTHAADLSAPWTVKAIDRVPTAHRLRWIDPDGSGRKVLVVLPLVGPDAVAPDYKSPVSIFIYRAPEWKREVLTDSLTGLVHGVEPVDWPGVPGQALLSAGFMGIHLHRFANGAWSQTELTNGDPQAWPKSGTSDIRLGRLGQQRFIATIEPWHGSKIVMYNESAGGWQRLPIDDTLTNGHGLAVVDIDADGRDEVVAGQRGGERSLILYAASKDGTAWTRRVLDEGGMAGAACAAADLNADKRTDIVCIGTATANLKWYENLGRVG